MVLPEELVNYVKDQLLNDAPVANIIADVKSKGYQISSSTIYKIRANIVPQRPELPLPLVVPEIRQQVQVPQEEQKPQTPAWNFMPVEEPPIAGILIASMDIQETKVLLQMSKNEQNILGRQYQYGQNHTLQQIMVNIATMCTEMMVHQLLITSQYMVELGERYSVQTPTQRFDFENFGFSKVKFAKHSQMIAVKYAKLFQKDIILLQLDETMTSFSCKKQSYAFQNLLVQHSIVARHAHDTRQVKQTCPYHDFCLQNFLSVKQISNAERDFELSAFYAAQLVYNLYLSNPDSLIVLIGKVLQVFNPQKFVFKLKESLNNFHNDFSIDFLADTFVHFASPDAAVQGGLNWSEKQACDDREQIQMQMSPQNMNMNAAYSPAYKMLKAPLADPKLFSRPPTANESAGNGGNQTPYEIELLATMMRGEGEEEY